MGYEVMEPWEPCDVDVDKVVVAVLMTLIVAPVLCWLGVGVAVLGEAQGADV